MCSCMVSTALHITLCCVFKSSGTLSFCYFVQALYWSNVYRRQCLEKKFLQIHLQFDTAACQESKTVIEVSSQPLTGYLIILRFAALLIFRRFVVETYCLLLVQKPFFYFSPLVWFWLRMLIDKLKRNQYSEANIRLFIYKSSTSTMIGVSRILMKETIRKLFEIYSF